MSETTIEIVLVDDAKEAPQSPQPSSQEPKERKPLPTVKPSQLPSQEPQQTSEPKNPAPPDTEPVKENTQPEKLANVFETFTDKLTGSLSRALSKTEKIVGDVIKAPKQILGDFLSKFDLGKTAMGAAGSMFGGGRREIAELGERLARAISDMERSLVDALGGKRKKTQSEDGEEPQLPLARQRLPVLPPQKRIVPQGPPPPPPLRAARQKTTTELGKQFRRIAFGRPLSKSKTGRAIRRNLRSAARTFKSGKGILKRDLKYLGNTLTGPTRKKLAPVFNKIKSFTKPMRDRVGSVAKRGVSRAKSRLGIGTTAKAAALTQTGVGSTVSGSAAAGAGAVAAGSGTATAVAGGATAAGGAAAGLASLVPPIAAVVVVLGGLALAGRSLMNWYKRQADELEQFSGAISGVRANIENERVVNKVERAQKIGPSVASVEAAKGRFEDAMTDITTEIYTELAKLAPLLEFVVDYATATARGIETMINLVQATTAAATLQPQQAAKEFAEALESQRKMVEAMGDAFSTNQNGQKEWVLGQNPFGRRFQQNIVPNAANPGLGPRGRI